MFNEIPDNPLALFHTWFTEAKAMALPDPTVMSLATATTQGKPSVRIVLLKHYDEKGFYFYTNLTSRKAKELQGNPYAALSFYWHTLEKQVRVEGRVEQVSNKEADAYFASRPRGRQIGAWSSRQSQVLESEQALQDRVQKITVQFEGRDIPRPDFWSGYRVIPESTEFWVQGASRLHARLLYKKKGKQWVHYRLYP